MTTINRLSTAETVATNDLIAIFSTQNGDARKASVFSLAAAIVPLIPAPSIPAAPVERKILEIPVVNNFTINLPATTDNIWLKIDNTVPGVFSGIINLPPFPGIIDGQIVNMSTKTALDNVTILAPGSDVPNVPSNFIFYQFLTLRYDATNNFWYRTG
jgi:hypothetical protein